MRKVFALLLILRSFGALAQDGEVEEFLRPKILALDKSVMLAQRFNEEVAKVAYEYNLAFVDDEMKPTIRSVYKGGKNETLRIDYRYAVEESRTDSTKRPTKKQVVVYQRISGELRVITDIYNFLFSAHLTPERIMDASTVGSTITHQGKQHQFIFQADDYEPGYWVMTFVR